jgi:hypothetical protein
MDERSGTTVNDTTVNDTHTNTTRSLSGGQTAVACSACGHPWDEHDQIAARFCAATTVGHHDRGCVCTARSSSPS